MNNLENIKKVLAQLSALVGNKVEKLIEKLETELNAKIDDPDLVKDILNAVEIVLKVEEKELHEEEKLKAIGLIQEQHQQIELLKILEATIKALYKKPTPEMESQLKQIMSKLNTSFAKELRLAA